MGALNSMPLCSRGRGEEEAVDRNNNLPTRPDQNALQVVESQPEATSTPKPVHVEDRDLGDSSIESRDNPVDRDRLRVEADSGLEQSSDELDSGVDTNKLDTPPQPDSLDDDGLMEDDFDDYELDQEIPEINSDDDDEDDASAPEEDGNDEDAEVRDAPDGKEDEPAEVTAASIKRPPTPLEDIDLSKLEDEVCEPEAGVGADEAESEDEMEMEKRMRAAGDKEGSDTAAAITSMLNQLTANDDFNAFGRDLATR